jgi:hypothetical protein
MERCVIGPSHLQEKCLVHLVLSSLGTVHDCSYCRTSKIPWETSLSEFHPFREDYWCCMQGLVHCACLTPKPYFCSLAVWSCLMQEAGRVERNCRFSEIFWPLHFSIQFCCQPYMPMRRNSQSSECPSGRTRAFLLIFKVPWLLAQYLVHTQ